MFGDPFQSPISERVEKLEDEIVLAPLDSNKRWTQAPSQDRLEHLGRLLQGSQRSQSAFDPVWVEVKWNNLSRRLTTGSVGEVGTLVSRHTISGLLKEQGFPQT
jgi:hypothetical protein